MNKILIICGPTATGKTNLGLKLAKRFNGQIISADSRQVYQGMNIGTGKDLPIKAKKNQDGHYLIKGVKVWGYDLVKPNQDFSVAHFVEFAHLRIKKIWQEGGLPILVGGTGLYLKAVIRPINTINIPANPRLRSNLNRLDISKLQTKLKTINPDRFKQMNLSDQLNPRRLIRAIEVHLQKGQTLRPDSFITDTLWVGLKATKTLLDKKVEERVIKRLKAGAQTELKKLLESGYSFDLPSMSAMGYQQWQPFFNQKINLGELKHSWVTNEKQYLRRQLTWFNRQPHLHWFDISKPNYQKLVASQVQSWYTKK
jgi:tRNA dimethylallyltransferase